MRVNLQQQQPRYENDKERLRKYCTDDVTIITPYRFSHNSHSISHLISLSLFHCLWHRLPMLHSLCSVCIAFLSLFLSFPTSLSMYVRVHVFPFSLPLSISLSLSVTLSVSFSLTHFLTHSLQTKLYRKLIFSQRWSMTWVTIAVLRGKHYYTSWWAFLYLLEVLCSYVTSVIRLANILMFLLILQTLILSAVAKSQIFQSCW